jgi:hypothetical protein
MGLFGLFESEEEKQARLKRKIEELVANGFVQPVQVCYDDNDQFDKSLEISLYDD